MAKIGKLTKLKSAIKKWPSIGKLSRNTSTIAAAATSTDDSDHDHDDQENNNNNSTKLHAVYVGRSRRRYFLSSDVILHPLFQELIDKSSGFNVDHDDALDEEEEEEDGVVVACEVVLFEHLLWMIQSGDIGTQFGSMQELVEFYTY